LANFTPREAAVLQRLLNGDRPKEIANDLGISPKTVVAHLGKLRLKLGARNSAHLVALVNRDDLLRPYDERFPVTVSGRTGPDRPEGTT
jgi:DNA-binding CsgD family transcriptional regulator